MRSAERSPAASKGSSMSDSGTVVQLISAIESRDRSHVLDFFTEESVYHNMPMEPCRGLEAIWIELAQVLDLADAVDWQVHAIAGTGDGRVLTERTDRFRVNGHWAEFQVMGIFEVRGGKVMHWRDYFDLQQGLSALAGATR